MNTMDRPPTEPRPARAPVEADVLVVGGGPAGTATAIWLARHGRRVALVEKGTHPRFHIGESLLPMSMPLLEELGVLEAVASAGVRKRGADFPSADPEGYHVFRFEHTLRPSPSYAFQVRRADFDRVLFEQARREGVVLHEQTRIGRVATTDDGVSATGTGPDGAEVAFRARYLVDATGRDTLLGKQFALKRRYRTHQSAALYAHFAGVKRRPGEDAGNISIYRTADGWVWVIPLPDGVTSIGLVCGPDSLRGRAGDNEGFLMRALRAIPALAERLEDPRIVGNLEAAGNYSYECTQMAGPRWITVGDASMFLDPIFSTGVHFALHGAKSAAALVHAVLDDPRAEARLQRRYQKTQRAAVRRVSWFIVRFNTPVMRHLFANPRNVLGVENAMISMLAGDLYRDDGIGWRLNVFKAIYYLHCLAFPREALRGVSLLRRRRREVDASLA